MQKVSYETMKHSHRSQRIVVKFSTSGEVSLHFDAQETEGTLLEVKLLCRALEEQDGIVMTRPGRRLQGRAFASEIQVRYPFMHQTLDRS